ncbi:MAG: copper amine oxidase N-terminal domain-containing protein [Clostridia bacterium]|nr:copper amine oxidase N-terminal domain-containing protein [Clostridia bacterium]
MKKKILSILLTVVLVLTMGLSVFAQGKIFVDLQEVMTDTPSQIINDRTMVPVRAITEMLGYDVYWRADKRQVDVCEKDSTVPVIIMQIDSTMAYYTKYDAELGDYVGVEAILDSPATIVNDRTLVPLRFISEAVGYVVEYDEASADVYLFSPEYIERHQGDGKGGEPGGTADDGKGESISGLDEDGKGEVIPLTYEEQVYVLEQTTETWLNMTAEEKEAYVVLIGRWWEDYENIIVEDYEDMVKVIDHQMEQYYKNAVNEYVFFTVCEIYEVDKNIYVVE